jgi:hypothetical protein
MSSTTPASAAELSYSPCLREERERRCEHDIQRETRAKALGHPGHPVSHDEQREREEWQQRLGRVA